MGKKSRLNYESHSVGNRILLLGNHRDLEKEGKGDEENWNDIFYFSYLGHIVKPKLSIQVSIERNSLCSSTEK